MFAAIPSNWRPLIRESVGTSSSRTFETYDSGTSEMSVSIPGGKVTVKEKRSDAGVSMTEQVSVENTKQAGTSTGQIIVSFDADESSDCQALISRSIRKRKLAAEKSVGVPKLPVKPMNRANCLNLSPEVEAGVPTPRVVMVDERRGENLPRSVAIGEVNGGEGSSRTPVPVYFVPKPVSKDVTVIDQQCDLVANLSSTPGGVPSYRLNLRHMGTCIQNTGESRESDGSIERMALLAEGMFDGLSGSDTFQQMSLEAQDAQTRNQLFAVFDKFHRLTRLRNAQAALAEESLARSAEESVKYRKVQTENRRFREENLKLVRCQEKMEKELQDLRSELTAVKLERDAGKIKLDMEEKRTAGLQQELATMPGKIKWWKEKVITACSDGFLEYYGDINYSAADIGPYVTKRVAAIDESRAGLPSSDEEDIGDDEYEDMPVGEEEGTSLPSFPGP